MDRPLKPLGKNQKSNFLTKSPDTRDFLVLIFGLGATGLAFLDQSFRPAYGEFLLLVIGGYLGQLKPRD